MNILLINHYAGSIYHGMEYRPYYLAKEWVDNGHSVTIVAADKSHIRAKNPTINNEYEIEMIDGIKYIWIKTSEYAENGAKRFINILSFLKKLSKYEKDILDESKPDVVIASSTYPLDIYPAKKMAKKANAKLVYEVHDLWPLSPMELGGMSKWHPFIMLMQKAENDAYKHSHGVVSLLPNAEQYMMEHGLTKGKFRYVPNGIKISEWENNKEKLEDSSITLLQKLKEDNQFLVAYAGTHGVANALDTFIKTAKELENEKISFLLVGKGPEKESLKKIASEIKVTNVYFLDPVKKEQIPYLLSEMDALYIGLQRQSLFRFGISPNKMFDYMMAKKPIIQAIDAGNNMVKEANCGIYSEPENVKSIAEGILQLYNMTDVERQKMGENGYNFIKENHDYSKLAFNFIEYVNQFGK